MQAYCMKCRAKREMRDARAITMKNGKPATQGVCPVCGTKMFRIGSKQEQTFPFVSNSLDLTLGQGYLIRVHNHKRCFFSCGFTLIIRYPAGTCLKLFAALFPVQGKGLRNGTW